MRLSRAPAVLAVLLALLAGCSEADRVPGDGGDGADGGTGGGPTDSDVAGEVPDPSQGFAVLVARGRLEGEGPAPGSVAACSIAPPDGHIDLEAKEAWARPGQHSFKVGQTWLLVLDEVEVDDPRSSGCIVRTLTPFTATGEWHPQGVESGFSLDVSPDGDRLLVSRNALEPGGEFQTYAEFEDGDYTFSGDLTFRHAGWWPASAFEEREEREEDAGGEGAVWWA